MTREKKYAEVFIWVDGASRGNPGPAASGVVIQQPDGQPVKSLAFGLGTSTNNTAEYCGMVLGLQEALAMGAKKVQIFTDSELVAKQWNGQYQVKDAALRVFFRLAKHLDSFFEQVTVTHVPREQNKLADEQANLALDKGDLFA